MGREILFNFYNLRDDCYEYKKTKGATSMTQK